MKKIVWSEMGPDLRAEALRKLNRLADAKVRYDGTMMPYAWAERIAPLLTYWLAGRGGAIWDLGPSRAQRQEGLTLWNMPVLSWEELGRVERTERKGVLS